MTRAHGLVPGTLGVHYTHRALRPAGPALAPEGEICFPAHKASETDPSLPSSLPRSQMAAAGGSALQPACSLLRAAEERRKKLEPGAAPGSAASRSPSGLSPRRGTHRLPWRPSRGHTLLFTSLMRAGEGKGIGISLEGEGGDQRLHCALRDYWGLGAVPWGGRRARPPSPISQGSVWADDQAAGTGALGGFCRALFEDFWVNMK